MSQVSDECVCRLVTKGTFVSTKASALLDDHEGGTAIKITAIFEKARGGVLFIDETYTLLESKYGQDAIGILVENIQPHAQDM